VGLEGLNSFLTSNNTHSRIISDRLNSFELSGTTGELSGNIGRKSGEFLGFLFFSVILSKFVIYLLLYS
jgi:hypothetical protein